MDKEEYKRQNEQREKKKNAQSFGDRWFGWWKTPSDRFAALIALFTAVLAFVAWQQLGAMRSTDEAIHRQLTIMQGQLDAIERDQQPYISVAETIIGPLFQPMANSTVGWIAWNIPYVNSGKGSARNVTINSFIAIESGPFKRSHATARTEPMQIDEIAASKTGWFSIVSEPIFTQTKFDILKKQDLAIRVLVEFVYSDSLRKAYETDLCFGLYSSGAIAGLTPASCKKKKES